MGVLVTPGVFVGVLDGIGPLGQELPAPHGPTNTTVAMESATTSFPQTYATPKKVSVGGPTEPLALFPLQFL